MVKTDTPIFLERVQKIQQVLDATPNRIPEDLSEYSQSMLDGVNQRLELGVDHSIVALAGGTGSGKSSLANVLAEYDFAEVGLKRPTTSQIASCSWSQQAGNLLDWLGVGLEHRAQYGSELRTASESGFEGLVLLDLPDHDSIVSEHKIIVDRVLPLVDLMIWVVDPQKYADQALHGGYLQKLNQSQSKTIVVLNQIDTVNEEDRPTIVADLKRLLQEDGLSEVEVFAVSTQSHAGIDELRDLLRKIVDERSIVAQKVAEDLAHISRTLLAYHTQNPVSDLGIFTNEQVKELKRISAVIPVIERLKVTVENGGNPRTPTTFQTPQLAAVELFRERWIEKVISGLPGLWQESILTNLKDAKTLARDLQNRLNEVEIDESQPPKEKRINVLRRISWILTLAFLIGSLTALALQNTTLLLVGGIGAVVFIGFGVGLSVGLHRHRRREAQSRIATLEREVNLTLEEFVVQELNSWPQSVFDEYTKLRNLLS